MKNQFGGVKLITIIGVILIFAVILLLIIVFAGLNDHEEVSKNNILTNTYTSDTPADIKGENTNFELSFLQLEDKQENMIYSPLSIKYALKMLQEGASDNTYTQIEEIVGNSNLPTYRNIENTLSLANGIFIRDTYYQYVKDNYKDILVNKYNAEIRQDEFQSAKNANEWIEEKTFGKIENMLNDDIVTNPDLQMLLINALAIDMEWKNQFDENDTNGRKFYLADGTEMIATMMSRESSSEDISYYMGDDITAITIDLKEYEETQLEFMALMPNTNLEQYVDSLTMDNIEEITQKLNSASNTKAGVKINIPKFEFDYDLNLKDDLIKLGITDAFNGNLANFSNMADLERTQKNLYVSDALHKANIEFSEEGVKAAAVTVFGMMDVTSIGVEKEIPIEINIDNPFVFLIRDKNTNEIWFVGTVYEPNYWEEDKGDYSTQW